MSVSPRPLHPAQLAYAPSAASEWMARASEFSDALVRPLGLVLDSLPPGTQGVETLIREFVRLADRAGFTTLTESTAAGGAELLERCAYRILATLCEGDSALGALVAISRAPARCVALARRLDPSIDRRGQVPLPISDRLGCVVTTARDRLWLRREGLGWRLSGTTRVAVAGAAIASHAAVSCNTDGAKGRRVVTIVPLNRPGVQRRQPLTGRRGQAAATLAFDGLWLEPERVLDGGDADPSLGAWLRATEHLTEATAALGAARAAYRGTTRWRAEQRLLPSRQQTQWARRLVSAQINVEALATALAAGDAGELALLSERARDLRRRLGWCAVSLSRWAFVGCGANASRAEGVQYADRTRFYPEKLLREALAAHADCALRTGPSARLPAASTSDRSMSWAT